MGHSNTFGPSFGSGLNSRMPGPSGNKGFKKLTSMNVGAAEPQEETSAGDPSYLITPEYKSELVY